MTVLSNPLAVFQKTVKKHANLKLTLVEEQTLIKAAQKGDKQALETLLGKDIRFIVKIASECFEFELLRHSDLPFALGDFIGWGATGYLKAMKHYDEKKGKRLLTYAGYWIRRLIYYYLKEENCLIRIPHKEQGKRRAAGVYVFPQVGSLDAPSSPNENAVPWLEFLVDHDKEEKIFAFADFDLWQKVIQRAPLTKREKTILFQRIFMEKELKQLGRRYHLSKEGVRQIENKAKNKIRAACLSLISEQRNLKKKSLGEARVVLKTSGDLNLKELLTMVPYADRR